MNISTILDRQFLVTVSVSAGVLLAVLCVECSIAGTMHSTACVSPCMGTRVALRAPIQPPSADFRALLARARQ